MSEERPFCEKCGYVERYVPMYCQRCYEALEREIEELKRELENLEWRYQELTEKYDKLRYYSRLMR